MRRTANEFCVACTVAAATLATAVPVAEAHSPIEGVGTFYGHLLHPLVVPSQALLLIAVALLLGQQGREHARIGLVALVAGFGGGLAASSLGWIDGTREPVLLFAAMAIGGVVGVALRLPLLLTILAAAAAGTAIGLDSALGDLSGRETPLALAGLTAGVVYFVILGAGLTVGLTKDWQRIGVRVAGAWVFAASLMVFALSLTVGGPRAAAAQRIAGIVASC
jgi:urease accessory protein